MSDFDPKLLEALKLLTERPEILKAAMALARTNVVPNGAPKPTVAELWTQYAKAAPSLLKPETWRVRQMYRGHYGRLVLGLDDGTKSTVADLPWDAVTPRLAEIYRAAREQEDNHQGGTVAPGTVNRELSTLQSMFQYHVDIRKMIPTNPIVGFTKVDEAPYARQTYLTPDARRRFIEAGHPVFQDLAIVADRCGGMRQKEVRLLRKSEVDFVGQVINLPSSRSKNKRPRVIPFASDVEAILRRHCDNSRGQYVFASPSDPARCKPIPPATFWGWMNTARDRSGVVGVNGEVTCFHHIRHAAVTDLLQDKIDSTTVMAVAGMSPQTLSRYSKFGPEQQQRLREHMESKLAAPSPERAGPRRAAAVRPGRMARR